jgi:4-hydroxy-2-oxoglutarate aldolase
MPALITPFDKNGEIDLEAHRNNVGVLAELGLEGFLVAGSTGEGSTIEPGERSALVGTVRVALGARPHVVVGIWAESVRMAMAQIAESAEAGADSVLVVTPTTFARRSTVTQEAYFRAVAEASPLPTLLYSVPPNTGYALDEQVTARLSAHPNIVGMKDSGGDAVRIQRIITAAPDNFLLFNGASASLSLAMAAGAHGAITASTNYMPGLMMALVAAGRRSTAKAISLQHGVTAISAGVEAHGIAGVKAASPAAGLRPGTLRPPLASLDKKTAAVVLSIANGT